MTDLVVCSGCGAQVDRDLHLLCPACRADVSGDAPAPAYAPATASTRGSAPPPPTGQEDPDADGWVCTAPGCGGAALAADVSVCPYCGSGRIDAASGQLVLRAEADGHEVALTGPGPWSLGRRQALTPRLAEIRTVSRHHADLERRPTGLYVRDIGSDNGVYVDGERLPSGGERQLQAGAQLGLGRSVTYVLHVP